MFCALNTMYLRERLVNTEPPDRRGKRLVLDDRDCRAGREILRCWMRGTGNGADSGGRRARIRLSS
jgi:hypothetical protein